jgi:GGDEF domain-containing protein
VLLLEADHFKCVNDYWRLPGRCCSELPIPSAAPAPQDMAGRFGGEEFLVLLPDTTAVAA